MSMEELLVLLVAAGEECKDYVVPISSGDEKQCLPMK